MKKLLPLSILLISFFTTYGQITYFENFEGGNGGWTATGSWELGIPSAGTVETDSLQTILNYSLN